MPQRQAPRSIDAEAERRFSVGFEAVMDELARRQQQPPDTDRVSEPRKARLWGQRDPRVEYDQFVQTLMTTGFQPQDLESMLIVQEHPDLAEVYGPPTPGEPNWREQPNAEEVARELATLAEHPFRLGTYNHILDPDERVTEAERIHRRWQKMQGGSAATEDDDDEAGEPVMGGY